MKTKEDIVKNSAKLANVTLDTADKVFDAIFESIRQELLAGEEVSFRRFGGFKLLTRSARMGVDPRNGTPVAIPEKLRIKFHIARAFVAALNGESK